MKTLKRMHKELTMLYTHSIYNESLIMFLVGCSPFVLILLLSYDNPVIKNIMIVMGFIYIISSILKPYIHWKLYVKPIFDKSTDEIVKELELVTKYSFMYNKIKNGEDW